MDMILLAVIALAMAVTLLCAALQRSAAFYDNKEYDCFLDEDNEHLYYDRTSIRYKKGYFKNSKTLK